MGYIRHHAIVVTSWKMEMVTEAHGAADAMGLPVSSLVPCVVNGGASFAVLPDGSKEGWAESDEMDVSRAKFLEWCGLQAFEDGSNCLDYCEIQFGDDNGDDRMLSSGGKLLP